MLETAVNDPHNGNVDHSVFVESGQQCMLQQSHAPIQSFTACAYCLLKARVLLAALCSIYSSYDRQHLPSGHDRVCASWLQSCMLWHGKGVIPGCHGLLTLF